MFVVQLDAQAGFGFHAASVNQGTEGIPGRCRTKTDTNARKGACVTRIEGVDDVGVRSQWSRGSRIRRSGSEKGRPNAHTILDNLVSKKEYNMKLTHLPFRSWFGHCMKGRGREEVIVSAAFVACRNIVPPRCSFQQQRQLFSVR